jgi:hypothetical protein
MVNSLELIKVKIKKRKKINTEKTKRKKDLNVKNIDYKNKEYDAILEKIFLKKKNFSKYF